MVRIVAAQVVDVQCHLGVVHETLEELEEQVDIEIPDGATLERNVVFQSRAAGEIDHHPGEGLIEGHIGVAVAANTGLVQRLVEGLANGDAEILHRVVGIDLQVACRLDVEIDQAMAGHLLQHVFQKGQARGNAECTGAVQVQADGNLGLFGIAFH